MRKGIIPNQVIPLLISCGGNGVNSSHHEVTEDTTEPHPSLDVWLVLADRLFSLTKWKDGANQISGFSLSRDPK